MLEVYQINQCTSLSESFLPVFIVVQLNDTINCFHERKAIVDAEAVGVKMYNAHSLEFFLADLITTLSLKKFDVAVVDLIANECGIALARGLGLPVASFWGFSFQGEYIHTMKLWCRHGVLSYSMV